VIWLVCINKEQGASVGEMLRATASFGENRVLVIDRSPHILGVDWPHVVRNGNGQGWLAGMMRDIGLAYCMERDPDFSGCLFVDGDRIPQEDLLPFCTGYATLFSVNDDTRGAVPGRLVDCTEYCADFHNSPFFSPALYISARAIRSVMESGRLFCADFDGFWGEEDRDLGDRIHSAGFTIMATDAKVSGALVDRFAAGAETRNYWLRKARYEERKAKFNATKEN
jgi:hypothetical protein